MATEEWAAISQHLSHPWEKVPEIARQEVPDMARQQVPDIARQEVSDIARQEVPDIARQVLISPEGELNYDKPLSLGAYQARLLSLSKNGDKRLKQAQADDKKKP